MGTIKSILEKIIKAIVVISILMGVTAEILLFRFHLYHYPLIINFYPQELILFICMVIALIISIRYKVKYFNWLALIGIILAVINLIGFNVLMNIDIKGDLTGYINPFYTRINRATLRAIPCQI